MKQTQTLVLIAATSMAFFACKKDSSNESSNMVQPTTQTSKNSNVNATMDAPPSVLKYTDVAANLVAREYQEIAIPQGYVPQIKLSDYPGTELHLFVKQNELVEAYKFPSADIATEGGGQNGCSHKENAGGPGQTAGCYQDGSDCKVSVDTINGTTTVTIVCC